MADLSIVLEAIKNDAANAIMDVPGIGRGAIDFSRFMNLKPGQKMEMKVVNGFWRDVTPKEVANG